MSKLSVVKIFPENYGFKSFCLNYRTNDVMPNEFGTDEIKAIITNMFDTLYDYPSGVGLAANQVGILKRICVVDYKRDGKNPLVCINPKYFPLTNEIFESREQCISFPNISVYLNRYSKIKVTYQNIMGEHKELSAEGFKAFVLQHEIDHLDGKVFLDYDCKKESCDSFSMRTAKKAMEVLTNGKT